MIKPGEYQHFKGGHYEVLFVVKHSETLEEMVVYRALYGTKEVWVRPLPNFCEEVEVDGQKVPRFKLLKEDDLHERKDGKVQ